MSYPAEILGEGKNRGREQAELLETNHVENEEEGILILGKRSEKSTIITRMSVEGGKRMNE